MRAPDIVLRASWLPRPDAPNSKDSPYLWEPEPRRLYGPRVAALRNQAPHHTGAPPASGPHSSARTRRQAPKISGKTTLESLDNHRQ